MESLKEFREVNLYLRGIIPLLGFRSAVVEYDRSKRFAGESKYPLKKMLELAFEAVTSFSVFPLRLISFMGFIVFVGAMAVTGWALWVALFTDARYLVGLRWSCRCTFLVVCSSWRLALSESTWGSSTSRQNPGPGSYIGSYWWLSRGPGRPVPATSELGFAGWR